MNNIPANVTPRRIQRRRSAGWRMPEGAVYVGRPTEWGNPWRVGDRLMLQWPLGAAVQTGREVVITPALAVELYRLVFTPDAAEIRAMFAGRQRLADWLWQQGWRRDVRPEDVNDPRPATQVWERRVVGTDVAETRLHLVLDTTGRAVVHEAVLGQLLLDAGWERTA